MGSPTYDSISYKVALGEQKTITQINSVKIVVKYCFERQNI